jgi:hypothetical protein
VIAGDPAVIAESSSWWASRPAFDRGVTPANLGASKPRRKPACSVTPSATLLSSW